LTPYYKHVPAMLDLNTFFGNALYEQETVLCRLLREEGSDKGGGLHNFSSLYHYLFNDIRLEVKNIFELGLGTNNTLLPSNMGPHGVPGASLRAWRSYFPNANVIGADIDSNILFEEDRIRTFYCDQRDTKSIEFL